MENQVVSLNDFQASIGENTKVYPFLFQRSYISGTSPETFLESGRSTNGVVYFEQTESWGGWFPALLYCKTKLKIILSDTFERQYRRVVKVNRVSLSEAKRYNPTFGSTLSELHGSIEPAELPIDRHGNLLDRE